MNNPTTPAPADDKLIISGIRLSLTDALKNLVRDKVGKLLRQDPRIVRVRMDLEHDQTKAADQEFVVKGRVEIGGPDLLAQAASADTYKSVDEVVSKLSRALRKRAADRKGKRNHPHAADIGLGLPKTT